MTAAALILALFVNQAEPLKCGPDDSACWRRMTLQEIHRGDAEAKRADAAEKALQRSENDRMEDARRDHGAGFFFCGVLVGAGFIGLGTTIALKIIAAGKH
jgi:hypothetical protein